MCAAGRGERTLLGQRPIRRNRLRQYQRCDIAAGNARSPRGAGSADCSRERPQLCSARVSRCQVLG
eukprot:1011719-Pyramimonas_sp.AAC.1